ncbi:LamG-like jellyroll fold domain-containing protein [Opitutus sp. ER46]|uniref:LamG-like jellyroll fold domain-containing protein n=1 Tax=Opitutus sp. ER46 TaxID=2161864 RepID=UPI000D2F9760|nr:LamG-like jellyroll fold domain-containing protein [Opitutus sp. ER46]PTX96579.1 hypothetical protein DB354_07950 [Opitutus sp. ER46]
MKSNHACCAGLLSRCRLRPIPALLILFALLALPAVATITEPNNQKVVFRYRSFSGTTPDWVSPLTSLGNISHASGSADLVTTDRGAGFDNLTVTDFDGSTEYVQGAGTITTVDGAADDSFTVEAWFKADTLSGPRTLFSNTEDYRGFALRLNGARLRGEVRFKNGSTYVNQIVAQEAAYADLETGAWYCAVLHVRKTSSAYEIRLYLNGTRVAFVTTSSQWDGVYQSVELPMVGAEPAGGVGSSSFFDGQIYAVTVSNHDLYLDNYVKNAVVRDGSRYGGMIGYHDYLSTTAGVDFRIQATISDYTDLGSSQVVGRMQLPYLNDGYVPQGLGYDAANGYFYVSYYWCGDDGSTGSTTANSDKISIVAEIDRSTQTLRRTFRLYRPNGDANYGHLGGLEYYNGSLYVTYGTSVYRYPLASAPSPTYVFDPKTFANPRADQNPLTDVTTYPLSSYLQGNTSNSTLHLATDTDGDVVLWVSEYDSAAKKKILGFVLNSSGGITTPAKYAFTLPVFSVNGMACYNMTATECYFYVVTGGVWKRVRYLKSSATAQSTTTVFSGPPGTEDLVLVGTQVWTTSETGGRYYQKGAGWDNLFPFLFGVSP